MIVPDEVSDRIQFVEAEEALDARRNPYAVIKRAEKRLKPEAWPAITPTFSVAGQSQIFTIGSCFAREVEDNLARLGYKIPTLSITLPIEEISGRPSSLLNKYTAPAIYQELAWASEIYLRDDVARDDDSYRFLYELDNGGVIDLNLSGFVPVTRQRFFERRREIYRVFREAFRSSLVTITLGMIESWFDKETGLFIQTAPPVKDKSKLGRFAFALLDFETCLNYMTKTIDLIRSTNNCPILVTTSPITLNRTFTKMDVITANMESKSLLRTVCGELVRRYDRVDYFPSYESVMLTRNWDVFETDLVHVKDTFVAKIVRHLVEGYFSDASHAGKAYQEAYGLSRDGLIDQAIEVFRASEIDYSKNPDVGVFYADLLWRKRDVESARLVLEPIVETNGSHHAGWRLISSVYQRLGDSPKALNAARSAVALDPLNTGYLRHLSNVLINMGNFEETETVLRQAITINSREASTQVLLARVFIAQSRLAEAETFARKATDLQPSAADCHAILIDALLGQEKLSEAREVLKVAFSLVANSSSLERYQRELL